MKEKSKPLSFSTTMRNPNRIIQFLAIIQEFDEQILTKDLIQKIIYKIIQKKLYKPMIIGRIKVLNDIFNSADQFFSKEQLSYIIENAKQKHKEKGFDFGWDSRFDTWYKLSKELGFIFYEMNKKIRISQSAKLLLKSYLDTEDDNANKLIYKVFLNAFVKYQSNNPFRKNANKIRPIPLLLKLLTLFKNEKHPYLNVKELAFLICYDKNNPDSLFKYIKDFRAKWKVNASNEVIYEHSLELLKTTNRKRFKMNQILQEGLDDFIRKIRMTGLFTLRGYDGKWIDINRLEEKKSFIYNRKLFRYQRI